MPSRQLPVRPDITQLRHQAKDLLRAIRIGDETALNNLREFHPHPPSQVDVNLADAQLALARSYGAPSWRRVVLSCNVIDAIWNDDVDALRALVVLHPELLEEDAGIRGTNWGPPLSYAANLGRDNIIRMLRELGAADLQHAIDRAVLQGRIDTARMLHEMMGGPKPPPGAFGSPAYTLSVPGTEFLFAIGGELVDERGRPDAPADVVIQSDSRSPERKHRILELYSEHGFELPDTPMMALHRGRLDLLDAHITRDPRLLTRTFSFEDIYPRSLKCEPLKGNGYDEMLPRTPIAGGTLLHVAVEFDELEIARWLLERGMRADQRAAVDANGFGGHTALFNAVVSYPHFWMNFTGGWAGTQKPQQADFADLLLEHGANPNARASFRELLPATSGGGMRDHRDVTPLAWGEAFGNRMIVSEPAMRAVESRGGHR